MNRLNAPLPLAAQIIESNAEHLRLLGKLTGDDGERAAEAVISRGMTLSAVEASRGEFWSELSKRQSAGRAAGVDDVLGIRTDDRELQPYSITRAMKYLCGYAPAQDASLEREVSDYAAKRTKTEATGIWLPFGLATRDFNTGTATEAGNLVSKARDYGADPLRKLTAITRLGCATLTGLRGTLSLPSFTSATAPAWKSEVASAVSIAEETVAHELTPKRVAVQFLLSRQALLQSPNLELDAVLSRHMVQACMELAANGALLGTGSNDSPIGITSTTGVGPVVGGTNGATLAWTHLRDLVARPDTGNVDRSAPGWIINPATEAFLRSTVRASGLPFMMPDDGRLWGFPTEVSNQLPADGSKGAANGTCSTLIYGADWSSLVVGIYGPGVDVVVDRYTYAEVAKIRIVANLYVGIAVVKPAAFSFMVDATL